MQISSITAKDKQKVRVLKKNNQFQQSYTLHPFKPIILDRKTLGNQINSKLYKKYSSSQNYFYQKQVRDILTKSTSKVFIQYYDYITYDQVEEYLKRLYLITEFKSKISLLTEYYKFHIDIPRMFMMPTTDILNNFHDKKRRIQYYEVAKIVEEENKKNPKSAPKGIVGDLPSKGSHSSSESLLNQSQKLYKPKPNEIFLKDVSSFINKGLTRQEYKNNKLNKKQQYKLINYVNKGEQSITLQEINQKLAEIINSQYFNDKSSFIMQDQNKQQQNTDSFEKHVQKNEIKKQILAEQKQQEQNNHCNMLLNMQRLNQVYIISIYTKILKLFQRIQLLHIRKIDFNQFRQKSVYPEPIDPQPIQYGTKVIYSSKNSKSKSEFDFGESKNLLKQLKPSQIKVEEYIKNYEKQVQEEEKQKLYNSKKEFKLDLKNLDLLGIKVQSAKNSQTTKFKFSQYNQQQQRIQSPRLNQVKKSQSQGKPDKNQKNSLSNKEYDKQFQNKQRKRCSQVITSSIGGNKNQQKQPQCTTERGSKSKSVPKDISLTHRPLNFHHQNIQNMKNLQQNQKNCNNSIISKNNSQNNSYIKIILSPTMSRQSSMILNSNIHQHHKQFSQQDQNIVKTTTSTYQTYQDTQKEYGPKSNHKYSKSQNQNLKLDLQFLNNFDTQRLSKDLISPQFSKNASKQLIQEVKNLKQQQKSVGMKVFNLGNAESFHIRPTKDFLDGIQTERNNIKSTHVWNKSQQFLSIRQRQKPNEQKIQQINYGRKLF